MIDGHIHIERRDYTLEWIQKYVDRAVEMQLRRFVLINQYLI